MQNTKKKEDISPLSSNIRVSEKQSEKSRNSDTKNSTLEQHSSGIVPGRSPPFRDPQVIRWRISDLFYEDGEPKYYPNMLPIL